MRSLLAVAEHGAISEAALTIGLSQPALSRRIQQLEDYFATPLFERSGRGVVLTEMGRLVAREGADMFGRYERLRASVDAHIRLDTGIVRVGGGATAVAFLLPAAIAAFQSKNSGVLFQLKEAGSREVESDVVEERLELGVVTLPVHSPELETRPLMRDQIVLVAARDHPLAHKKRPAVSELDGKSLVGFEAGSAIRQLIDGALREAGVEMRVVMELRSLAAILQMVATTRSLAFVSELALPADETRVCPLSLRGMKITRELALIKKRGRPLSPASGAFATALRAGPLCR